MVDEDKFELALHSVGIFVSVVTIAFFITSRLSSGNLKLHIFTSRFNYLRIVFVVAWLAGGSMRLIYAKTFIDFVEGLFWFSLGIAYLFLIKSGVDIRENGILYEGGFISWKGIESYRWKKHENTHSLILVRRKPFLGFSKEITLKVPVEKVENTDTLLNQHLQGEALR
jgi:hypothetical protein